MKQNNMLYCTIVTPKKTNRYTNVQSATLPAFSGQAQILPGHAESFFVLKQGDILLRYSNRKTERISITSGECYFSGDKLTVVL